jgi:ornithine carbamoyltransferase
MEAFQVDLKTLQNADKTAKDGAIFLHCLPAFHGLDTQIGVKIADLYGKKYPAVKSGELEVTDAVIKSKYCKAFDEAENRMHSIKAIMLATIGY